MNIASSLCVGLCLVGACVAQTTSTTIQIGGPGALGAQGGDPPTLSDGSGATASMTFVYDAALHTLDVVVDNTTPQVAGQDNPVISEVFFNVPIYAVTGVTLTNQVGGPGGLTPNFAFQFDADFLDNSNSLVSGGLGKFACRLQAAGSLVGIANPSATTWTLPLAQLYEGPVTFSFQLTGTHLGTLDAAVFANIGSDNPPGSLSTIAAVKFQSGGVGGQGSGFIGGLNQCPAGMWYVGDPVIGGGPVTLYSSSAVGCHACVGISASPGPSVLDGFVVPLGLPIFVLGNFTFGDSIEDILINMPNLASLNGLTLYMAFAVDQIGGGVAFSNQVSFTLTL